MNTRKMLQSLRDERYDLYFEREGCDTDEERAEFDILLDACEKEIKRLEATL